MSVCEKNRVLRAEQNGELVQVLVQVSWINDTVGIGLFVCLMGYVECRYTDTPFS